MKRLKAINEYPPLFEAAFPGKGITPENIAKAIATYERTVISGRAPFDAWIDGDERAISDAAKRGFALFNTKAECNECHSGWNFTDDSFHDIGLASTDIGRGKFLTEVVKSQHAFKTPGLREITQRAPFMHNGSMKTLEQVIEHYSHRRDRPSEPVRTDQAAEPHRTGESGSGCVSEDADEQSQPHGRARASPITFSRTDKDYDMNSLKLIAVAAFIGGISTGYARRNAASVRRARSSRRPKSASRRATC